MTAAFRDDLILDSGYRGLLAGDQIQSGLQRFAGSFQGRAQTGDKDGAALTRPRVGTPSATVQNSNRSAVLGQYWTSRITED